MLGYYIKGQTMYGQLQGKVREYIISELCGFSEEWKFDIDMVDGEPFVVGYGPDNVVIRSTIEKFHKDFPYLLLASIIDLYKFSDYEMKNFGGIMIIRSWFYNVFTIYAVQTDCNLGDDIIEFKIFGRNNAKCIPSAIYSNKGGTFMSPFLLFDFCEYILKEELVPPFLLLLDPIEYFKRYSIIINKYQELDRGRTLGIYELLLGYFPEMNKELVHRYWALRYVLADLCIDMVFVVGGLLVDLYALD